MCNRLNIPHVHTWTDTHVLVKCHLGKVTSAINHRKITFLIWEINLQRFSKVISVFCECVNPVGAPGNCHSAKFLSYDKRTKANSASLHHITTQCEDKAQTRWEPYLDLALMQPHRQPKLQTSIRPTWIFAAIFPLPITPLFHHLSC